MATHQIRLIGPWEFEWESDGGGPGVPTEAASGSIKMPCEWRGLFGDVAGTAVFSRNFHRPTNLDPHERVVIVFTGIGGVGRVNLNEETLVQFGESPRPVEVDVTDFLKPFNVLEIDLRFDPDSDPTPGGLFAPVVLEIRS